MNAGMMNPGMGNPGMAQTGGAPTTELMMVPDKMVGLIIGRGGEQITRLQAESGCKIQMAQDSQGDIFNIILFYEELYYFLIRFCEHS